MKSRMTLKYYLKNSLTSVIIISVLFYLWISNPEDKSAYQLVLASLINSLFFPFSKHFIERATLLFTKKELWQQDFFVNPAGGSLVAIFDIFCFILAIPVCLLFLVIKIIKTLSSLTRRL